MMTHTRNRTILPHAAAIVRDADPHAFRLVMLLAVLVDAAENARHAVLLVHLSTCEAGQKKLVGLEALLGGLGKARNLDAALLVLTARDAERVVQLRAHGARKRIERMEPERGKKKG